VPGHSSAAVMEIHAAMDLSKTTTCYLSFDSVQLSQKCHDPDGKSNSYEHKKQ
jgi:hypothetical protein